MELTARQQAADHVRQILGDITLDRSHLLPALWKLVEYHAWLSSDLIEGLAEAMKIPTAEIYGVASFYSLLPLQSVERLTIRVCTDVMCALKKSDDLRHHLIATWQNSGVTVMESPCLGQCDRAPAALIGFQVDAPCDRSSLGALIGKELTTND